MTILKQADYMGHEIAKLSKYVKTSGQTFSDSFLQKILQKKPQKNLELVSSPHFCKSFL